MQPIGDTRCDVGVPYIELSVDGSLLGLLD